MARSESELRAIETRQLLGENAMTQIPASVRTFLACALLSISFTVSTFAQSTEWKEHSSEKGKFSVLLPGDPTIGYRAGPADSGAAVSYVTNYQKDAKAWSVIYYDLPAIPPAAADVKKLLERGRNSYTAKPSGEKSLPLNGYPALEFKMSIDDRGRIQIVRIILVRQRVYELWVVTQAKQSDSENVTKFFDSFKPSPLTDEEVVAAAQAAIADKEKAVPRKIMVSSGVLEGLAIKKVQPAYPPEAKAARVSGLVKIRVLISEEGNVMEAEAFEGPDLLRESALVAARQWVFRPSELMGRPVRVEGALIFKFAPR
jgi:protein TonB